MYMYSFYVCVRSPFDKTFQFVRPDYTHFAREQRASFSRKVYLADELNMNELTNIVKKLNDEHI